VTNVLSGARRTQPLESDLTTTRFLLDTRSSSHGSTPKTATRIVQGPCPTAIRAPRCGARIPATAAINGGRTSSTTSARNRPAQVGTDTAVTRAHQRAPARHGAHTRCRWPSRRSNTRHADTSLNLLWRLRSPSYPRGYMLFENGVVIVSARGAVARYPPTMGARRMVYKPRADARPVHRRWR
jgi:hypothetical protein